MATDRAGIIAAEVVLPCTDVGATLAFFTDRLGFRVDSVTPADHPEVVVISGHGVRLRLQRGDARAPGVLCLRCENPDAVAAGANPLTAPNGTRIELVAAETPLEVPPGQPAFVLQPLDEDATWVTGRAGMRYRDLIPGRQGGRFIASHIQIAAGGAVPDYVHFHVIRFQLIYCYRGWVRVAYEDQGPPLQMNAGDCVLQPPKIRHRVLECSPGLEVIEIGCPAAHQTCADRELKLPTPEAHPEREFDDQRFVHHVAAEAVWQPWRHSGFECRDTAIAAATRGLVNVVVVRPTGAPARGWWSTSAELTFWFVLAGHCALHRQDAPPAALTAGDCVALPPGMTVGLADVATDLEFLELTTDG